MDGEGGGGSSNYFGKYGKAIKCSVDILLHEYCAQRNFRIAILYFQSQKDRYYKTKKMSKNDNFQSFLVILRDIQTSLWEFWKSCQIFSQCSALYFIQRKMSDSNISFQVFRICSEME